MTHNGGTVPDWAQISADCRAALHAWLTPTPEPEVIAATQALDSHCFNGLVMLAGYVGDLMFRTTLNTEGARQLAGECYNAIPVRLPRDPHGSVELARGGRRRRCPSDSAERPRRQQTFTTWVGVASGRPLEYR